MTSALSIATVFFFTLSPEIRFLSSIGKALLTSNTNMTKVPPLRHTCGMRRRRSAVGSSVDGLRVPFISH